jgi:hypothetical protein
MESAEFFSLKNIVIVGIVYIELAPVTLCILLIVTVHREV